MTALNAEISPNSIVLSMDTLASRKDDSGKTVPSYFTQKFEYYLFTQSILCGTGDFSIIRIAMDKARSILSKEVKTFSLIIRDFLKNNIEKVNTDTTIYIFGFDEDLNTHAYALRSTDRFDMQEIASYSNPNWILKPKCEEAIDYLLNGDSNNKIHIFKELMKIEKNIDDKKIENKVGIGGQNILIDLVVKDGKILSITNIIDEFEDYDKQYKFCLDNL
ncbi:terminase [Lactobacillus johnsonii]|uniref:Terminase n=1 Tax=Lactobacillus johnsonii TaxID=33959 RepID=A0A9X7Y6H7_LACJH|nr:terminase [Lactobacillus johnsonii]QLL68639.1 terminase [Lactobacillus johnsonii]